MKTILITHYCFGNWGPPCRTVRFQTVVGEVEHATDLERHGRPSKPLSLRAVVNI
jgi:hypothetical protein